MKKLNADLLNNYIDRIAQYDLAEHNVFGSGYLVMQNNRIVYENYFGEMGRKDGGKVNEETLYRLASMTKPITAIAILLLVDDKLLSLSDPVKKFIPAFGDICITSENGENLGKPKTDISILHLLAHVSGFGGIRGYELSDHDREILKIR